MHDNAPPHTARLTQETVEHLGLELLPHPPYSPDLGASDYHHFRPMKKMLGAEIRIRYRGAISRLAVA